MFASLTLLVFTAVLAHAYEQKCTSCADGVDSFYDGCNTCACDSAIKGGTSCTELFCTQEVYPETSCRRKCDGYMALKSEDGETRCRCNGGEMTTDCTASELPAPAPAGQCVSCKTDGVTSFFDGCNSCTCTDNGVAVCTEKLCIAVVSDDCSQSCDGATVFNPAVNADCVCKSGKFSDECKPRDTCNTCDTPGVTSFFDGCNSCTCTDNGFAVCTKRFCTQVVSDDCSSRCDGAIAFNPAVNADCICKGGKFSDECKSVQRTCKGEGNNVCAANGAACKDAPRRCLDCAMYDCVDACEAGGADECAEKNQLCKVSPKECFTTPCPQYDCVDQLDACEAEGNEVCRAGGKTCQLSPKQCITAPCPQYDCVDKKADACEAEGNEVCASKDMTCMLSPKQCFTTPCPQYDCVTQPDACEAEGNRVCDNKGMTCFLEPKQCFTTPCPQYGCRATEECGCDADSPRCDRGKACVNNKCLDVQLPELPEGVADGTPACIRGFGQCCGPNQSFCDEESICHNNECINPEECPAPAEECGCDAEKPRCDHGYACVNNKCITAKLPELPEGVADGAPACIRGFGQCCGPNQSFCDEESICHNNECIAAAECPAPTDDCGCEAEQQICKSGSVCVANKCQPIDFSPFAADGAPLCIRGPVEGQFCCGESLKACDHGQVCHNDECVDADTCEASMSSSEESVEECGCEHGVCVGAGVCVNNECVVSATLAIECSASADKGEYCCGKSLRVCEDGQLCDNNQCIDKDSCGVMEESTAEFGSDSSAPSNVIVNAALAVAAIAVACM